MMIKHCSIRANVSIHRLEHLCTLLRPNSIYENDRFTQDLIHLIEEQS